MLWPDSVVMCCGVKPLPWTQNGGAPSLDRPVFLSPCGFDLCMSVLLLIPLLLLFSVFHLSCFPGFHYYDNVLYCIIYCHI